MNTLLLIDDDEQLTLSLRSYLEAKGYSVLCESQGQDALRKVEKEYLDLVLLDLNLAGVDGLTVLSEIRKADPTLPVVILTGNAQISTAVSAIKLGAQDYLTKPFTMDHLLIAIERTLKERSLSKEVEAMRQRLRAQKGEFLVLGSSPATEQALKQVRIVAPTDLTVILQGESGSGKEVMARLIDQYSSRREGPFVAVDCGTLQESLVESELFGHEKGAFTGADERTLGQFEIAYRGTLFLDEIGNLPLPIQAKLLRVLQEKKIRRVGGKKDIPVDVRIIAASNKDLHLAVQEGTFREDLFHRLNQFMIRVPALRERKEDIPALTQQFLSEAGRLLNKTVDRIDPAAIKQLLAHDWPGNVRELKNVVTRAALLAEDQILPEHLHLHSSTRFETRTDQPTAGKTLKDFSRAATAEREREIILRVLKECGDNRSKAAEKLGIHRTALYYKLRKYRIKV